LIFFGKESQLCVLEANQRQAGAVAIFAFFVLAETYAPVLLERKAARLRKETGNPNLKSKLDTGLTEKELFIRAITRPTKFLFLSPVCATTALYLATLYGELYILFTTFTFVYEEIYHFSSRGAGLSFIGSGVGTIIGLGFAGKLSDQIVRRRMAQGKEGKPEDRLALIITVPAAITLPAGIIIYGWTTDKHVHWIAPMIGTGIMGFGLMAIIMCIQTYLVDAFTIYAASAIAANAVLRSLLGALLPLCGLDIYEKLGLGWGNTLLGLIAVAMAPVPWLLALYGDKVRTSPKWQVKF
jgi:MFS family permease